MKNAFLAVGVILTLLSTGGFTVLGVVGGLLILIGIFGFKKKIINCTDGVIK